jgi:acyl-CoA thioesterase
VHDLKIGKKISTVRVELNAADTKGNMVSCVTALVTQSNLAMENGVTGASNINFKDDMPRREDCIRHAETWLMNVAPIARKLRVLMPSGGPDLRWKDRFGPGIRESWVKMDDGSSLHSMLLGHLCDPILALLLLWAVDHREALKASLAYWYPALSVSMEITRDPKCAEWLFVRIKTDGLLNGRYVSDVSVLNEEGELIALAKIIGLVVKMSQGENSGVRKREAKL